MTVPECAHAAGSPKTQWAVTGKSPNPGYLKGVSILRVHYVQRRKHEKPDRYFLAGSVTACVSGLCSVQASWAVRKL